MRDSPAEVVIPELDAAASSVGTSSVGPISVGAFSVGASVRAFSLEGLQGVCLELGGRVLGRRVWRACACRVCLELGRRVLGRCVWRLYMEGAYEA
jgi:hypothetical protein